MGFFAQGKQKISTCFYDERLGGGAIPKFVKDVRGFSADMPHPGDLSSKIALLQRIPQFCLTDFNPLVSL